VILRMGIITLLPFWTWTNSRF